MLWNQIGLGLNATVHLWAAGPESGFLIFTKPQSPDLENGTNDNHLNG